MNRDDERLRIGMRSYAARIAAEQTLPPSSLIWLRAERRRRRLAVERAERPLRLMQGVGMLAGLAAAIWILYRFAGAIQWPVLGTTMVAMAIGAGVLVAGGCLAMLAASRRPLI